MKVIVFVALVMLAWILSWRFHWLKVPQPSFYQYTTLLLIVVVQPLVIYTTIWRNYHSSNHLKEPLEIDLQQHEIKMRGESFYTEIRWEKMYKIVELNDWFLLYQNNLSAVIIPKKDFQYNEIVAFKQMLLTVQKVPVHLKKETNA